MAGRKPYARTARGKFLAWYVYHEGHQVWLGRFEKEALENFERLKSGKPVIRPERAPALSSAPLVQELVDTYLDHRLKNGTRATYNWYRTTLKPFGAEFGALKANILKSQAVIDWINSVKTWGQNMRHAAGRSITTVFLYAVANDLIKDNPLKGFKKERAVPREDGELSPEEWTRLALEVKGSDFEDAMMFMRLTAARPLECRSIEARHYQRGMIVFPISESKGKRAERIIRIADKSLAIIERLVALYPSGPLFRDSRGKAWTRDSFGKRCRKLAKLCNIPQLIPYSFRTTYATESVIAGVDSLVLMRIMGHTSTAMLASVYARHGNRHDYMIEQSLRAVAGV